MKKKAEVQDLEDRRASAQRTLSRLGPQLAQQPPPVASIFHSVVVLSTTLGIIAIPSLWKICLGPKETHR